MLLFCLYMCVLKLFRTLQMLIWFPLGYFFSFQYNEELHYVEPCLNGTLVQADRTNKEVGPATGWAHQMSWHTISLTVST